MISILLGPSFPCLRGSVSRVLAVSRHVLKVGVAWHRDRPRLESVFASSVLCLGQTGRCPPLPPQAAEPALASRCWPEGRLLGLPLLARARPVFFSLGLLCPEERSRRPWGEPPAHCAVCRSCASQFAPQNRREDSVSLEISH